MNRQTTYSYDEMGRLTREVFPDGSVEESTFDAEGRQLNLKQRAGQVTSFSYDAVGRLTKTTYPDGTFTQTSYDAIGRVTTSTDALNHTTRYEYDPNCGCSGRRAKIIDALGRETRFTYDEVGNQLTQTDARLHTTRFEYDALNRRVKTIYEDTTFEQVSYDALGRNVSKTDQAGKATQFAYDALGRLSNVTDALNQVTSYGYDELGNQLSQTDALNRVTRFEYDKLGRRIKRTLPLGQVESYAYNSVGNLLSRTDFRGKVTSYSYDPMNRLLSKTPDASLSEPSISYSYNAVGQRASMSDRSGVTLYTYDARNRLTSKQTPQGTLTYAYDAASNLLSTRSSNTNGVNTSYAYDALNRMSSVTDNAAVIGTRPGTGSSSLFYDEVGNLASFNTANGVTTSYTYNSLNRLTNLTSSKAATSLASYAYTLGAAGNRTSVTEANGRVASYSYDALYRLTNETITNDAVSANNGSITYSYDAVGNRLSRTSSVAAVPSTTSAVDGNDRLASDAYDNNGNTVSSPDSTTPTASNAYQYDFENRLVKLNASTPSEVSYVYDGDGNRVSKTVGTGASATTTRYLVDTNNATGYAQVVEELAVVAGVSSVQRVYVYGHTRLSQQQLIGGNWVASFYGYDGHGSVRYLTDASGAVTDSYTYDAFGVLIQRTGTTPNDYLYAGEQFDSHLGLYYNRARYLNQATGRFFSMDPFQGEKYLPVSLHKYTYVEDNPINNRDPKGLETVATLLGTFNVRMTLAAIAAISLVCTINAVASSEGAPLPNGAPCKLPKRKKRCFEAYPNHITREALLRQNPYYIHNSEAEALNVLRSLTTEPLTRGTTGLATGGPCSLSSGYVVGQHRNILKVRDGLSAGSIGMCPCCDDSSGDARIIDLYAVLNFKLDPKDDDKKPEPGDDFDVPPEWR